MRICYICNEYPPGPHGGVGTMVQLLSRALVQAGHEVRVIGLYSAKYRALDHFRDEGVEVTCLREPRHRFGWLRGRYQLFRRVKLWAQKKEIQLVEAPDSRGWFAGWPKLPVPLVQRANGSFSYFARDLGTHVDARTRFLEAKSYARTDGWSAVSCHTAQVTQQVFGLQRPPGAILYNPIEKLPTAGDAMGRNPLEVVYSGTLVKKKGIISLIDAWPHVLAKHPAATLNIFGKDGCADNGESMTQHLQARLPAHCALSVKWHGHVDRSRLLGALRTAGVGIFPSYSEAFAFAPMESMATGCPTIYTKLGSGAELIRDGLDGLLIDPNSPAEIASTICRLLADRELARRLGDAGRARIDDSFSLQSLLPANLTFYSTTIESFRAPSMLRSGNN